MIGIVGGGISGLALTHEFATADVPSVTWEASDRPGGVIRTRHVDGHVLECGPQRLRMVGPVRTLIEDLELGSEVVTAPDLPLLGYRDGDVHEIPLSPRAALSTDLLSWRAKARILAEPLTAGVRDGETVRDVLVRKFGQEAYQYCLGPLYGGLYASDPAEMPARYSLAKALAHAGIDRSVMLAVLHRLAAGKTETPAMCSFEDGLGRLTDALAANHADRVHLNARVRGLRRRDPGADDSPFLVETERGDWEVDDLVLTTPGPATASLLREVAPAAAERIGSLVFNPMVVVHVRSPLELDASGIKLPDGTPYSIRGITAHDALFERDGIYTAFLRGADEPDEDRGPLYEWSDSAIESLVVREFTAITGCDAAPVAVSRATPGMPAYDESWHCLEDLHLPAGLHLCTNYVARAGIPGRLGQARRLATTLSKSQTAPLLAK